MRRQFVSPDRAGCCSGAIQRVTADGAPRSARLGAGDVPARDRRIRPTRSLSKQPAGLGQSAERRVRDEPVAVDVGGEPRPDTGLRSSWEVTAPGTGQPDVGPSSISVAPKGATPLGRLVSSLAFARGRLLGGGRRRTTPAGEPGGTGRDRGCRGGSRCRFSCRDSISRRHRGEARASCAAPVKPGLGRNGWTPGRPSRQPPGGGGSKRNCIASRMDASTSSIRMPSSSSR